MTRIAVSFRLRQLPRRRRSRAPREWSDPWLRQAHAQCDGCGQRTAVMRLLGEVVVCESCHEAYLARWRREDAAAEHLEAVMDDAWARFEPGLERAFTGGDA